MRVQLHRTLSAGSDTSPSSSSRLLYLMRCLFTEPSSGASVSSIMMSSVLLKVDRVSLEGRPHAHCMTSCLLLASAKGPCTNFCQSELAARAVRMSALRLLASNRLQQHQRKFGISVIFSQVQVVPKPHHDILSVSEIQIQIPDSPGCHAK